MERGARLWRVRGGGSRPNRQWVNTGRGVGGNPRRAREAGRARQDNRIEDRERVGRARVTPGSTGSLCIGHHEAQILLCSPRSPTTDLGTHDDRQHRYEARRCSAPLGRPIGRQWCVMDPWMPPPRSVVRLRLLYVVMFARAAPSPCRMRGWGGVRDVLRRELCDISSTPRR